eukprot:GHVH01002877.1.p2 GENE.GHVH01002877.1~~GHVH01002877.1.p2  ORF type:complete len:179 (+),score=17.75 GHVH01002877.1:333-869(+)
MKLHQVMPLNGLTQISATSATLGLPLCLHQLLPNLSIQTLVCFPLYLHQLLPNLAIQTLVCFPLYLHQLLPNLSIQTLVCFPLYLHQLLPNLAIQTLDLAQIHMLTERQEVILMGENQVEANPFDSNPNLHEGRRRKEGGLNPKFDLGEQAEEDNLFHRRLPEDKDTLGSHLMVTSAP